MASVEYTRKTRNKKSTAMYANFATVYGAKLFADYLSTVGYDILAITEEPNDVKE